VTKNLKKILITKIIVWADQRRAHVCVPKIDFESNVCTINSLAFNIDKIDQFESYSVIIAQTYVKAVGKLSIVRLLKDIVKKTFVIY